MISTHHPPSHLSMEYGEPSPDFSVSLIQLDKVHGPHKAITRLLNEAKLIDIPGVHQAQQTSFYLSQQLETTFIVVPASGGNDYKCIKGNYSLSYLKWHIDPNTKLICKIVDIERPDFVQKMHVIDYIGFNSPLIRDGRSAKVFFKNVVRLNDLTNAFAPDKLPHMIERILGMTKRTFMPCEKFQ